MSTLKQMAERAARKATLHFAEAGEISPVFLAEDAEGDPLLLPYPQIENKDLCMAVVKMMFAEAEIVRYIKIAEGWLLLKPADYKIGSEPRPSKHPERIECVMITGEAYDEPTLLGYAKIVREPGRAPYLEKFQWDRSQGGSSGRMFNLLSAPAGKPLN